MLRRTFSKLSLVDNAPDKWSKDIRRLANGQLPIPNGDRLELFPFASLKTCTDSYLARRKIAGAQSEANCYELVCKHDNKVIALAACAHVLSPASLRRILETFASGSDHALYLQAFVAAYYNGNDGVVENDVSWATELIHVYTDSQPGQLSPQCIIRIFQAVCRLGTLPTDSRMQVLARSLVAEECSKLGLAFEKCRSGRDWLKAVELAGLLFHMGEPIPHILEQLLNTNVPFWRTWACWKPNVERLQLWRWLADDDLLSSFWQCLGPDFQNQGPQYDTLISRLVNTRDCTSWLQAHGFTVGVQLVFDDSFSARLTFVNKLSSVLDAVSKRRSIPELFFRRICQDEHQGLDVLSLRRWELASSTFPREPTFFSMLYGSLSTKPCSVEQVIKGLETMDAPQNADLRSYVMADIVHTTRATGGKTMSVFLHAVHGDKSWLEDAQRVLAYRGLWARFSWLPIMHVEGLELGSRVTRPAKGLNDLQELSHALADADSDFNVSAKTYICQTVCGLERYIDNNPMMALMEALHAIWTTNKTSSTRDAVLAISTYNRLGASHRLEIIRTMVPMPSDEARLLREAISNDDNVRKWAALPRIAGIAAQITHEAHQQITTESWQAYVTRAFDQHDVSSVILRGCSSHVFSGFRTFLQDVHKLFPRNGGVSPEQFEWLGRLALHDGFLDGIQPAPLLLLEYVLEEKREPAATQLLDVLAAVRQEQRMAQRAVVEFILLQLSHSSDLAQMWQVIRRISGAPKTGALTREGLPSKGFTLCQRLIAVLRAQTPDVAAVQVEIWMLSPDMDRSTQATLRSLAKALGLPSSLGPERARTFFALEIQRVLQRAKKVEGMVAQIRQRDRSGARRVFKRLGIEDLASPTEEMMEHLPMDVISHVEQIDDNNIELQVSTSSLNDLQRTAMGMRRGDSLAIRLRVDDSSTWQSFCVHVIDSEMDLQSFAHNPCRLNTPRMPSRPTCQTKHARIEYMVATCCWQVLKAQDPGQPSVTEVYRAVERALKDFGKSCMICNAEVGCDRYRATICKSAVCERRYLQSDLTLRLSDGYFDRPVLDLLLSAVLAAAQNPRKLDLLPKRPARLNNATIISALDTLKRYKTGTAPRSDAELAMSYACNAWRGFLASAAGSQRVPNLPNVLQFVVVDNPPEVMTAFQQHDSSQAHPVLFHGTTLDRLYAILSQGLKVLSNTNLQAHGASSGCGVYLAEEPSTSASYARPVGTTGTFAQVHQDYVSRGVLLAIECVGAPRGTGVHVETDPTKLLLRYVFMVPPAWAPPQAVHIVPALQSNFATLRSGARKS